MPEPNEREKTAISQIQQGNIQGLAYLVKAFQVEAIRLACMVTREQQLAAGHSP